MLARTLSFVLLFAAGVFAKPGNHVNNKKFSSMNCIKDYFSFVFEADSEKFKNSVIVQPKQVEDVALISHFYKQKQWPSMLFTDIKGIVDSLVITKNIIWFISNLDDLDSEILWNFPLETEISIISFGSISEVKVRQMYKTFESYGNIRLLAKNKNKSWTVYTQNVTEIDRRVATIKSLKTRCFTLTTIDRNRHGERWEQRVLLVESLPFAFDGKKAQSTINGIDVLILNALARKLKLHINFEVANDFNKFNRSQLE